MELCGRFISWGATTLETAGCQFRNGPGIVTGQVTKVDHEEVGVIDDRIRPSVDLAGATAIIDADRYRRDSAYQITGSSRSSDGTRLWFDGTTYEFARGLLEDPATDGVLPHAIELTVVKPFEGRIWRSAEREVPPRGVPEGKRVVGGRGHRNACRSSEPGDGCPRGN